MSTDYADYTDGHVLVVTREAGGSIKPGVKRSGTPGKRQLKRSSPRSGRQLYIVAAVARLRGLDCYWWS